MTQGRKVGDTGLAKVGQGAKPGWRVDLEARKSHARLLEQSQAAAGKELPTEDSGELQKFRRALEIIAMGEVETPCHVAADALGQRPSYAELLNEVDELRQINDLYATVFASLRAGASIDEFDFLPGVEEQDASE